MIEGFPRSGNTFSVAAFQIANGGSRTWAVTSTGAHLLRAKRLGIPAVALVRTPADAVPSYLIRRAGLHAEDVLVEYLDFYRTAWSARDAFVVGLFDDVTRDFGTVIDRAERAVRHAFARYEATPENEAAAFELVEEMNRLESRRRGGRDPRRPAVGRARIPEGRDRRIPAATAGRPAARRGAAALRAVRRARGGQGEGT